MSPPRYQDPALDEVVICAALHASLSLRTCVARHLQRQLQRFRQSTGDAPETAPETECNRCAAGAARAAALGLTGEFNWGRKSRDNAWLRRMAANGRRRHAGKLPEGDE